MTNTTSTLMSQDDLDKLTEKAAQEGQIALLKANATGPVQMASVVLAALQTAQNAVTQFMQKPLEQNPTVQSMAQYATQYATLIATLIAAQKSALPFQLIVQKAESDAQQAAMQALDNAASHRYDQMVAQLAATKAMQVAKDEQNKKDKQATLDAQAAAYKAALVAQAAAAQAAQAAQAEQAVQAERAALDAKAVSAWTSSLQLAATSQAVNAVNAANAANALQIALKTGNTAQIFALTVAQTYAANAAKISQAQLNAIVVNMSDVQLKTIFGTFNTLASGVFAGMSTSQISRIGLDNILMHFTSTQIINALTTVSTVSGSVLWTIVEPESKVVV